MQAADRKAIPATLEPDMGILWDYLGEEHKQRWLTLTSDRHLKSYKEVVDNAEKANEALSSARILLHPLRLASTILKQIRLVWLLRTYRRRFREYEKLLTGDPKYDLDGGERNRVFWTSFPKWELVHELESRSSNELDRIVRDIASI